MSTIATIENNAIIIWGGLMYISARLKQKRKEKKLTADYVAKKIGVAKSTLYRYENGDIDKMPIQILEKIAKIYNTSPTSLIGLEDEYNYELDNVIVKDSSYKLNEPQIDELILFIEFLLSKEDMPK